MKTSLWQRIGVRSLAVGLMLFTGSQVASAHPGNHGEVTLSRAADHLLFDPYHLGLLFFLLAAGIALTTFVMKLAIVRNRK